MDPITDTAPNKFENYFENHAGHTLSLKDTIFHAQFVENQIRLIDKIYPLTNLKDQPALEIGSGVGRLFHLLRQRSFSDYRGIELDTKACAFTNSCFGNYFAHQNIESYVAPDGLKFRSVWAFEVLEHIENPTQVVKKIHDILGTQGIFIGTSPYPFAKNIISDSTHISVLHPENWRRLFLKAGFGKVIIRPMTFPPLLWRLHSRLNIILPWYVPGLRLVSTSLIIAIKNNSSHVSGGMTS